MEVEEREGEPAGGGVKEEDDRYQTAAREVEGGGRAWRKVERWSEKRPTRGRGEKAGERKETQGTQAREEQERRWGERNEAGERMGGERWAAGGMGLKEGEGFKGVLSPLQRQGDKKGQGEPGAAGRERGGGEEKDEGVQEDKREGMMD